MLAEFINLAISTVVEIDARDSHTIGAGRNGTLGDIL
jgi:hypothetical protein